MVCSRVKEGNLCFSIWFRLIDWFIGKIRIRYDRTGKCQKQVNREEDQENPKKREKKFGRNNKS